MKMDLDGSSSSVGGDRSTRSVSFSDIDESRTVVRTTSPKLLGPDPEAQELGITPRVIGWVRSPLKNLDDCPHWQDKGPEAVLEIKEQYAPGLDGIQVGQEIELVTWLHLSDREVLHGCKHRIHKEPPRGVFSSRSPVRPNPIGLHEITVVALERGNGSTCVRVEALEALDGTPILDIKRSCRKDAGHDHV